MIPSTEIFAPATGTTNTLTGDTNSDAIKVDGHSRVIYLAPTVGETLTEDDAFELRRVVDETPTQRSIKQYDTNGAILLGANMAQFEILIRGSYVIRKIATTTELVGLYQTYGNDEGV
jgi:hypothetical protein